MPGHDRRSASDPDTDQSVQEQSSWGLPDLTGGLGNELVAGLIPDVSGLEERATGALDAAAEWAGLGGDEAVDDATRVAEVMEEDEVAPEPPSHFDGSGGYAYERVDADTFRITAAPSPGQVGIEVTREGKPRAFAAILAEYDAAVAEGSGLAGDGGAEALAAEAAEAVIEEAETQGPEADDSGGMGWVVDKLAALDEAYNPAHPLVEDLGQRASDLYAWWSGEDAGEEGAAEQAPQDVEDEAERALDEAMEPGGSRLPPVEDDRAWEDRIRSRAPEGKADAYVAYVDAAVARMHERGFTQATGAYVGALLDMEAARENGHWKEDSYNKSGAAGLTQFIPSTWKKMAETEGSFLNEYVADLEAKQGEPLSEEALLELRYDADLSIQSAMDYAMMNMEDPAYRARIEEIEGKDVHDLPGDRLFYYAYVAHHEGVTAEDNGRGTEYLGVSAGDEAEVDIGLTALRGKWKLNTPEGRRWKILVDAGMSESDLPADVKARVDAAEGDAKTAILEEYALTPDPENLDIFEKAYVAWLDMVIGKREGTWYA